MEVDKSSGLLMVDRPQKLSNVMPCLYGFVPQTYCHNHVATHTQAALKQTTEYAALAENMPGDQDPLDICVFTSCDFPWAGVMVEARVVGGYRMIDSKEADDKIIAVLKGDGVYGEVEDVSQLPPKPLAQLEHYFLTYKKLPQAGEPPQTIITHLYDGKEAEKIVALAHKDYREAFPSGIL